MPSRSRKLTVTGNISDRDIAFYPEMVDMEDEPWTVHESHPMIACIDPVNKIARIPKARTLATEQIRYHELAHAAHSGKHGHETPRVNRVCKMLEEFRVDSILRDSGIRVYQRHDDFNWVAILADIPALPFDSAMLYLQVRFQAEGMCAPEVKSAYITAASRLDVRTRELLEEAVSEIAGDPSVTKREEWVRKLATYFEAPVTPPKPPPVKEEVQKEIARQEEKEEAEEADEALIIARAAAAEGAAKDQKAGKTPPIGSLPMFGAAEIHDHCGRHVHHKVVRAPSKPTGRGYVPEYMEHYCEPGRPIYRTDHRGGTIVIDMSGSMSWNWEFLREQIQLMPNLSVLCYAGVRTGRTDINGRICVVARDGRYDPLITLPEREHSGANNVDVEALLYGAKFKAPRVWLSDGCAVGGVLGAGAMREGAPMDLKLREVMRQHKYVRIETMPDTLHWLNRTKPVRYSTSGTQHGPRGNTATWHPPTRRV